jgi:signal peptidase I
MVNKIEEYKQDNQENEGLQRPEKEGKFLGSLGSFFLEIIKLAILSGITIGLVRYFLFKPFYVKGQSMEPNFYEKDYLIIDELSYSFREPKRGEVVVFKAPNGNDYYLKRVIGLPGERVKVENGKVIVYNEANPQGLVLDEIYLEDETLGTIMQTLSQDEYFLLGDNRDASYDSRRFGSISRSAIVGRAWLRGWPPTRVGAFNTPDYDLK